MRIDKELICKKCNSKNFEIKREVTYVYTYKVAPITQSQKSDEDENLPFLFDNREKANSSEFLLCLNCGEKYPYSFNETDESVDLTISQKAIRADNVTNPQYLG